MAKYICLFLTLFIFLSPVHFFAREYVVGGDIEYAPFAFIDKTGKPTGLQVEVLEAIAASANIKLKYKLTSWDVALPYLEAGETDLIVGMIYSEDRAKFLDFTIPIHTEYFSVFIRKDVPFKDLSNLYDFRLVVVEEDISIEKYLKPMGLLQNHIYAKSLAEALSIIEIGMADYVLAPNLLGVNEIRKNKFQNIEIKGPSIMPSIYCMAVPKGNTELLNILNEGITELRRNGQLTKILEKWRVYEKEDFKYRRIARVIVFIFAIVLVGLILVFVWVWSLRLQIKKKTYKLNLKNQELQRSEEKFRIITENSSDIIWHLDDTFHLTYISKADERIRGFKQEEVIGQSLFSILKPEGIEMLKAANKRRLEDLSKGIKSAPVIYELEELCKDGSWVWVEATATAYYDAEGKVSGYHGVSRDITERKKAELLLKQTESQLRELNSTKDKLFSIIAHDLRSPFNAILGFSELLIENSKDFEVAESQEYLGYIKSTANNTLNLLDNLLNWARSQTGTVIFAPEIIRLKPIINEIIEASGSSARIKHLKISHCHAIDIEVCADANMLKTILRNLISNAIKFSHSNGEILISATQTHSFIEITVSDSGIGMSDQILSKLFKIDTNIITVGTANEKGSGLGLILCKEFIEKHGGEIRVLSEPGKGSAFTFSLPLKT